jgi:hypothetical protein
MYEALHDLFSDPVGYVADRPKIWLLPVLIAGAILGGFKAAATSREARPYEGLIATARRSVVLGVIVGLLLSASLALIAMESESREASFSVRNWWNSESTFLLPLSLYVVGASMLWFGGVDLIRHVSLRLALLKKGALPLKCIAFLDQATRLTFMRRAGSGYVFRHDMLRDYFASR